MKTSAKCSLALHILLLIAVFSDRSPLTSRLLAKSTGCNPTIVRNLLSQLKRAGILDVKRGSGGASLLRDPETITVWDVYTAVEGGQPPQLIALHPRPSPECPVGRRIHLLLTAPYQEINEAAAKTMREQTLAELLENYQVAKLRTNSTLRTQGETT
jgi:Rrf2 family protein